MSPAKTLPTIAVINSSDDFLDIMCRFLRIEGYVAVPLKMMEVKSGQVDIVAFIKQHNPAIILYDIGFPYDENWQQYENVRALEICQNREFILITPNLDALKDTVGKEVEAFQLVEKEIDLKKIVIRVNEIWQKI